MKPLVNHFVGVYDPATGKMQVVEAKKMVIRGAVRAKQASASAMEENDQKQVCPFLIYIRQIQILTCNRA